MTALKIKPYAKAAPPANLADSPKSYQIYLEQELNKLKKTLTDSTAAIEQIQNSSPIVGHI